MSPSTGNCPLSLSTHSKFPSRWEKFSHHQQQHPHQQQQKQKRIGGGGVRDSSQGNVAVDLRSKYTRGISSLFNGWPKSSFSFFFANNQFFCFNCFFPWDSWVLTSKVEMFISLLKREIKMYCSLRVASELKFEIEMFLFLFLRPQNSRWLRIPLFKKLKML